MSTPPRRSFNTSSSSAEQTQPAQSQQQPDSPSQSTELTPRRQQKRDLFSDWDINRETNTRDVDTTEADSKPKRQFERPNTDGSGSRQSEVNDSDELDTPPFFRKRHR